MPEPLESALRRTDFRASLSTSYPAGRAPEGQRVNGQQRPPAPTYYARPAIKRPEWTWPVPAYFLVGGIAAGAFIVSALADMRGRREDRLLVRAGRLVALGGMVASPALLVADLGRPERFLNMLRVFRPRSMMNQGSWALVTLGGASALAAAVEALEGRARRRRRPVSFIRAPLRVLTWLGILPAAFVGSYTGVLLSATNVPLWAAGRRFMGPLFFSTALSTGLAGSRLVARTLGDLPHASEQRAERAEHLASGAELAIVLAAGLRLGRLAKPLVASPTGWLYQAGGIGLGLVAPLVLGTRRPSRARSLVSALLTLVGGAVSRFAIVEAGKRSADDPRAYFAYTRPAQADARRLPGADRTSMKPAA